MTDNSENLGALQPLSLPNTKFYFIPKLKNKPCHDNSDACHGGIDDAVHHHGIDNTAAFSDWSTGFK